MSSGTEGGPVFPPILLLVPLFRCICLSVYSMPCYCIDILALVRHPCTRSEGVGNPNPHLRILCCRVTCAACGSCVGRSTFDPDRHPLPAARLPCHPPSAFLSRGLTFHRIMNQRRGNAVAASGANQSEEDAKHVALQQYHETEGHFSLVRCVSHPFALPCANVLSEYRTSGISAWPT